VSEKLNIDPNSYYGLGVLCWTMTWGGCLDLYIADDSSPSMLYRGDCKGASLKLSCRLEFLQRRCREQAAWALTLLTTITTDGRTSRRQIFRRHK